MGLRINQNLSAQTALSYVRSNDSGLNKAIERLSSGLRIVRGADDPAGLIISEKYRAQVEGLGQAMNNAKDGVNMVQTAEGSLDEVSSILRNVRNLALHAANTGPNDTEALKADQQQIKAALQTLDRIAGTTQFGSKKVLDGSSGTQATVTNANVQFVSGTEATKSNTYAVNITTAAVRGKVTSNDGSATAGRTVADFTASAAGSGTSAAGGSITIGGALANGGAGITVNIATGDDLAAAVTKINADANVKASGLTASISSGSLKITSDRLSGGGADLTVQTDSADTKGVIGVDNAAAEQSTTAAASGASKLQKDELLTFSNGTNTVNVALTAGSTLSAAVSAINNANKTAGIKVTAAYNSTNNTFELTNDDYGSSTSVNNTFSSNQSGAGSTGLAAASGTSYNIAAANAGGTAGADVAGTIGGAAATGKGQFLTGNAGTDAEGLQLRVTANSTGAMGTTTVANNSLKFQIGAFTEQTVNLSIDSVSSARLGTAATGTKSMSQVNLSSIDVSDVTGDGAQDALKVIDSAISQVSTLRAKIGSFQKDVLESTQRNLSVAQQNIRNSESNIRDADFAEEMLNFSRGQILSQTGFSMLTQANQSAQQVLKLFG
ncbi:MAG: flagellin [Vulcanimicrobiota bacterium]